MTRARHYQRLLRLYPKDYRETYGAELIDTLLATARSPYLESLNLIGGAIAARARRLRPASEPWQDALAITSLLAPLLLLAGAAGSQHETAWFVVAHGSVNDVLRAFQDVPLWLAAGCAGYAAWRGKAIGWRVTALLATPVVATASTLWLYRDAPFRFQRIGIALPHVVYEYAPPLVVLALIIVVWRIATRRAAGKASSDAR